MYTHVQREEYARFNSASYIHKGRNAIALITMENCTSPWSRAGIPGRKRFVDNPCRRRRTKHARARGRKFFKHIYTSSSELLMRPGVLSRRGSARRVAGHAVLLRYTRCCFSIPPLCPGRTSVMALERSRGSSYRCGAWGKRTPVAHGRAKQVRSENRGAVREPGLTGTWKSATVTSLHTICRYLDWISRRCILMNAPRSSDRATERASERAHRYAERCSADPSLKR